MGQIQSATELSRQNIEHPMVTRSKAGIFKLKVYSILCNEHRNKQNNSELKDVHEALARKEWINPMTYEYNALSKNKGWKLVSPSLSHKVIGNKWVFRIKLDFEGNVLKHKARLVAKGFLQTSGVDYHETFSTVIKTSTLRLIRTLAISRNWSIT